MWGDPASDSEGLHGAGQPLGSLPTPHRGPASRKAVLEDSAPAPLPPRLRFTASKRRGGKPSSARIRRNAEREGTHAKGTEGQVCGGGGSGGGGSGALLRAGVAAFDQQKLEFSMGALPKTSVRGCGCAWRAPEQGRTPAGSPHAPSRWPPVSVSPEAPWCARVCLLGASSQCSPAASLGLEGRL